MKAKIAVATVSGKAYYLVVDELKRRNTPFMSLIPMDAIPIETRVVITTEEERHLINHERILAYREGVEPEALVNEALQIVQGKDYYEKIVIGVDPGEVLGLAVLADGRIVETGNCFSLEETLRRIKNILKNLEKDSTPSIAVKVGDGVPEYKEKLLQVLDEMLPLDVTLESVSEAGTNRLLSETTHRRGLRDIVSAIKIAGRNGRVFRRRKRDEHHG